MVDEKEETEVQICKQFGRGLVYVCRSVVVNIIMLVFLFLACLHRNVYKIPDYLLSELMTADFTPPNIHNLAKQVIPHHQ